MRPAASLIEGEMMNTKPLKAYEVYDGGDNWAIVFASNSATARREGAGECNCEWEEVDHCRRKPELDQFAPGPVPPLALIDAGWWYECAHCSCRIDKEMYDVLEDPHFDSNGVQPVERGRLLYCSKSCAAIASAAKRGRKAAESALVELVETKFPGSAVISANVYGSRLEAQDGYCTAYFTFPGGQHHATYKFGEGDDAWVCQVDEEAFRAAYR